MSNEQINIAVLFGLVVYCICFWQMVRYINKPCKY
jgi:hypothetical protein